MLNNQDRVERILRAIRQIVQHTTEHARSIIREHHLTIPQCLCLKLLAQPCSESWTVAALSRQIQLSTAATSRVVDKLVKDGLVSRDQDERDRRRVCLNLTTAGRKRVKTLPALLQEKFVTRYARLEMTDQKQLLECLETLAELMGASDLEKTQPSETDLSF